MSGSPRSPTKCPADRSINKGTQGINIAKSDSTRLMRDSSVLVGIILLLHMQTLGFKILSGDKSEPARVNNNINIIDFFMSILFCRSKASMEYRWASAVWLALIGTWPRCGRSALIANAGIVRKPSHASRRSLLDAEEAGKN